MNQAIINGDGKLYYNERFAFFTRPKDKRQACVYLLPTNDEVREFMTEFNLTDADVIDLRN